MLLRFFAQAVALGFVLGLAAASRAGVAEDAAEILTTANVTGGFVVHLGGGDGELTAALQTDSSIQVHGLASDATKLAAARKAIHAAEKYGDVSVVQFAGQELPYIDNLVNLIVVEDQGAVPQEEILRVLVPNGVALKKDANGQLPDSIAYGG